MRTSKAFVCSDASIAVPYVIEPTAHEVHSLWTSWARDGVTIVAPSLFRYEITNALHRAAESLNLDDHHAASLLKAGLDLPVQVFDFEDQHLQSLPLSRRFKLKAAYDAHYLALAEHLNCACYTRDARLFNAVKGSLPWVILVP